MVHAFEGWKKAQTLLFMITIGVIINPDDEIKKG